MAIFVLACSNKNKEAVTNEHQHEQTETAAEPQKPKSPRMAAMAMAGGNHIHIDYSAPSVRGRQIFGGLVAYDEIWVTGAHSATNISFDKDVMIGATQIPAGKYGFFTIPGKEKWTLIFNKQWDMHLADLYQQSEDILRMEVSPEVLPAPIEMLTYAVETPNDRTAVIAMSWDNIRISFEVKNR
ncbi:MAG: DUF2911 domain-containing protein [Saprospiraceae bacterium]|nr:DUF2911 domain-containing protein [Saprospiraceae bacterium]